ncbi:hypothetical protein LTS18_004157, partial [Coniosporium uncinatum]
MSTKATTAAAKNASAEAHKFPDWDTTKLSLFPAITTIVKAAPPTTNLSQPSWNEKILMYDPIVIEDLTAWICGQGVRVKRMLSKDCDEGKADDEADEDVKYWMVQRWCEDNTTTSKRETAEQLTLEIQQHGFTRHSVEQMRRILHEHSPDPEEEVDEQTASPSEEFEEAESEELLEEGSLTGFDLLYQEPFQSTYAESAQAALRQYPQWVLYEPQSYHPGIDDPSMWDLNPIDGLAQETASTLYETLPPA